MFTFCYQYKDDGRGCDRYHDFMRDPVCVDELAKVAVCVVAVVKFLNVLGTCHKYGTR